MATYEIVYNDGSSTELQCDNVRLESPLIVFYNEPNTDVFAINPFNNFKYVVNKDAKEIIGFITIDPNMLSN